MSAEATGHHLPEDTASDCVLTRARPCDLVSEPFPHLVMRGALAPDHYEALERAFPCGDILLKGYPPESNRNRHTGAHEILGDSRFHPLWRQFVARHTSAAFYHRVLQLFGRHIRAMHPDLETRLGKSLEALRSGIRYREPQAEIALDTQFSYLAPVTRASRSIGPHVDRDVALFAGLLYCRLPQDDSQGGDLILYRFKSATRRYYDFNRVPDRLVEAVATVPYERNCLIFFINSPHSLHGVSLRQVTPHPRRCINFLGQLRTSLFDIASLRSPDGIPPHESPGALR